jgi:hypothetical protein
MSWSRTPPPLSPRKPKQQSWEAPTINLYDPNREFFDDSSSSSSAKILNAPKKSSASSSSRKMKYNKYCLPSTMHQMSDPGTYMVKSPKSPGTQQHFEFELSTTPKYTKSPLKTHTSNRRYYEDTSTSDSAPATLTSPMKKYEYGAVSPKFEGSGKVLLE